MTILADDLVHVVCDLRMSIPGEVHICLLFGDLLLWGRDPSRLQPRDELITEVDRTKDRIAAMSAEPSTYEMGTLQRVEDAARFVCDYLTGTPLSQIRTERWPRVRTVER